MGRGGDAMQLSIFSCDQILIFVARICVLVEFKRA